MKISQVVRQGFRLVFSNFKMIGVIYTVNIVIALMLALPVFTHLRKALATSTYRDILSQRFDVGWWNAFHAKAEGLLQSVRPSLQGGFGPLLDNLELLLTGHFTTFGMLVLAVGLVFVFVSAFLNGGVIGLYEDEKKSFSMSRFFSLAGFYFHHMAALAATSIAVFAFIYKVLKPLLFRIVDGITSDWLSQPAAWFVNLAAFLIIILVIVFVKMIFDYAKIIVIADKKQSSWLCIWLAIKFVFRHLRSALGIYVSLMILSALVLIVFGFLISVLHPTQTVLLILVMMLQQTFIVAKITTRLTFYGSQLAFYQHYKSLEAQVKKRKR